jgi:hypothetical protein
MSVNGTVIVTCKLAVNLLPLDSSLATLLVGAGSTTRDIDGDENFGLDNPPTAGGQFAGRRKSAQLDFPAHLTTRFSKSPEMLEGPYMEANYALNPPAKGCYLKDLDCVCLLRTFR